MGFMARLLAARRTQEHLAALHAVDQMRASREAVAVGLARRQENQARLNCAPTPAPIETSVREAPTRKDAA